MLRLAIMVLLVFFFLLNSANGLKCKEGVNASIGGLPTYQWNVRECFYQSRCFSQELQIPLIKANNIHMTIEYGGCISENYASMITCENMFGENGKFNPAYLLDMITESQDIFLDMEADFRKKTLEHVEMLFSSGNGTAEFISGGLSLVKSLGFNIEKLSKLQKNFADILKLVIVSANKGRVDRNKYQTTTDELLKALGNLDTKNEKNSENIYKFLTNFDPRSNIESLKKSSFKPLIENVPGLVKVTLPNSWKAQTWFDVVIEILGDVNIADPRQSTSDAINTIKKAAKIPEKYHKYLDPFFDNLPDLIQQLTSGTNKLAIDSLLKILEGQSSKTDETTKISKALMNDIEKSFPDITLPDQVREMITWLPGLFYEFFPTDKAEINRVYLKLANLLNTDFQDPNTEVLEETKMSQFLTKILEVTPSALSEKEKQKTKVLYINLSRTIYDLLDSKQTEKTDIVFDTLIKGFKNYPELDSGKIISDLITNLGGTVPQVIKPFLKNMQKIIGSINSVSTTRKLNIFTALSQTVKDYKTTFPESEFPDLIQRYIDLIEYAAQYEPYSCNNRNSNEEYYDCFSEHIKKLHEKSKNISRLASDLMVDIYFAIFRVFDVKENNSPKPLLEPYLQIIRLLDPEDVKQLFRDYGMWTENMWSNSPQYATLDAFRQTFNKTIYKMTAKLGDAIKGLREFHRPDSCKYTSCEEELCNSHHLIRNAIPLTKPALVDEDKKVETTESSPTTTSGAEKARSTSQMLCFTLLGFLVIKL